MYFMVLRLQSMFLLDLTPFLNKNPFFFWFLKNTAAQRFQHGFYGKPPVSRLEWNSKPTPFPLESLFFSKFYPASPNCHSLFRNKVVTGIRPAVVNLNEAQPTSLLPFAWARAVFSAAAEDGWLQRLLLSHESEPSAQPSYAETPSAEPWSQPTEI